MVIIIINFLPFIENIALLAETALRFLELVQLKNLKIQACNCKSVLKAVFLKTKNSLIPKEKDWYLRLKILLLFKFMLKWLL